MNKIKFFMKTLNTYSNWYEVIFDNYGTYKPFKKILYKLRNGMRVYARAQTNDLGVINSLFILGENKKILDSITNKPVIVDIGAHIGVFSIYAGKKIPGARIYSYEPLPENYDMLLENIKLNKMANIKASKICVSNKRGKSKFYFSRKYTAGCSLTKEKNHDNSVFVKCVTVKDIFNSNKLRKCDLLKIDCEGHDHIIIRSIPKAYLRKIGFICAEYHAKGEVNSIKSFLESNGFSVHVEQATQDYGNIYARNLSPQHKEIP